MAAIYDYRTGDTITGGLQGCTVCDGAIQIAIGIAGDYGKPVVLGEDWA